MTYFNNPEQSGKALGLHDNDLLQQACAPGCSAVAKSQAVAASPGENRTQGSFLSSGTHKQATEVITLHNTKEEASTEFQALSYFL